MVINVLGKGGAGHENGVKSKTGVWAFSQAQWKIASGHEGCTLETGCETEITLGLDEPSPPEVTQWMGDLTWKKSAEFENSIHVLSPLVYSFVLECDGFMQHNLVGFLCTCYMTYSYLLLTLFWHIRFVIYVECCKMLVQGLWTDADFAIALVCSKLKSMCMVLSS